MLSRCLFYKNKWTFWSEICLPILYMSLLSSITPFSLHLSHTADGQWIQAQFYLFMYVCVSASKDLDWNRWAKNHITIADKAIPCLYIFQLVLNGMNWNRCSNQSWLFSMIFGHKVVVRNRWIAVQPICDVVDKLNITTLKPIAEVLRIFPCGQHFSSFYFTFGCVELWFAFTFVHLFP